MIRLSILTLLAMIAFASNSLLCRLALKQTPIDPASFTLFRIVSGAAALWLISRVAGSVPTAGKSQTGNWTSAAALFIYAAAFSFAYRALSAGTGALLLFGAVQATMILWGLYRGERLHIVQMLGLIVALSGLVVLVSPGISAPALAESILMLAAGIAWGIYSLRGKGERNPIAATTGNFIRAIIFAGALTLAVASAIHFDSLGTIYAVISGAITSGLGYVIWYSVLSEAAPVRLGPTHAATVQLSVPVLAATGGILLLGEPITLRYMLASATVLGGIALVIATKTRVA